MAIDIGSAAISRPSSLGSGNTRLNVDNSANATGTLDTCQIYGSIGGTGLIFGTFFLVSGTTYQCRDSENVGSYSAGSTQTFTGLTINVTTGDYLGHYITADGTIVRDTSGFAGILTVAGESIDPGDQASYGTLAGDTMSLYGTGTEAGGTTYYQTAGGATVSLGGVGGTISLIKQTQISKAGAVAIAGIISRKIGKSIGNASLNIASTVSYVRKVLVGGATMVIFGGAFLRNHIIEVVSSGLSRFGRGKGGRRAWDYRRRR